MLILSAAILLSSLCGCNPTPSNNNEETSSETTKAPDQTTDTTLDSRSIYANVITVYKDTSSPYESYPEGVDEQLVTELRKIKYEWGVVNAGYCFKDINHDGTEEMIFLNSDYRLQAILTQVNNKAKFVTMFHKNGFNGYIDENGVIYNSNIGKYLSWFESTSILLSNGELKCLSYYGYRANHLDIGDGDFCKKDSNGEDVIITEEEKDELVKQSIYFERPNDPIWKELLKEYLSYTSFGLEPL